MYWYKPAPTLWLRCTLRGRIASIVTMDVIYTGETVSGRARKCGDGWILDAPHITI